MLWLMEVKNLLSSQKLTLFKLDDDNNDVVDDDNNDYKSDRIEIMTSAHINGLLANGPLTNVKLDGQTDNRLPFPETSDNFILADSIAVRDHVARRHVFCNNVESRHDVDV